MNEYTKNIKKPSLPKNLNEVTDNVENIITDDCVLSGSYFKQFCISPNTAATDVEFIQNSFNQCVLDHVRLSNALFRNNRFDDCAMANADFNHSKLERVEFKSSKQLGMSLESSSGADILFTASNCQYANFRSVKLRGLKIYLLILARRDL